ncbi:ABC transporter ATP-binding protein [Dactylosporangium sp. CS-047395]|uniref:ABC transporter ATP-binding protein n=1 Tax=Dactylosporangium sp. CS-047395 TaxID=3239936 RepID=UPI003D89F542
MTDELARCVGVSRTYGAGPSAVVALHSVDCIVRPADRIALMGRSGSGKSTLLHLLAGLDEPTTGVIRRPARGEVGVVFQGPSLLAPLDVAENVALPLLLAGVRPVEAGVRAAAALRRAGVAGLAAQLPEELSGGQAQRVAVARVLAGSPRLILADEPTGQLDADHRDQVVALLLDAADELDAGLVVATHDARVADRFPQRWVMDNGSLREVEHP